MRAAAAEATVEVAGLLAITAGVWYNWGVGWALIVAGVLIVAVMIWRALR